MAFFGGCATVPLPQLPRQQCLLSRSHASIAAMFVALVAHSLRLITAQNDFCGVRTSTASSSKQRKSSKYNLKFRISIKVVPKSKLRDRWHKALTPLFCIRGVLLATGHQGYFR